MLFENRTRRDPFSYCVITFTENVSDGVSVSVGVCEMDAASGVKNNSRLGVRDSVGVTVNGDENVCGSSADVVSARLIVTVSVNVWVCGLLQVSPCVSVMGHVVVATIVSLNV